LENKLKILEALLFSSYHPLKNPEIMEVTGWANSEIEQLIAQLSQIYQERGIILRKIGGGWQLATCEEAAVPIAKMHKKEFSASLSGAQLETLAIVAYLQPINSARIAKIRGIKGSGLLTTLLKKRLIRFAGRESGPGKAPLYATTPQFLSHFGLNSLEDLPSLPLKEIPEWLKENEDRPLQQKLFKEEPDEYHS